MGHSTRHDPEPRYSEPGILSNVLSFVSREIGEFMINATGKAEVCSFFSDFKRNELNIDH
jgi:hypothetical protein